MSYQIASEQVDFFRKHGCLTLRDVLSQEEQRQLQTWAQEVHDLPISEDVPWMPYEEINSSGKRVLCRTENFADHHAGFNQILRSEKLLGILSQLNGQDMLLFKEKINYKLAGSGGYSPHIDAVAYTHVKMIKHLTILLAVDPSNMANGGLEVVEGSQEMDVPIESDNCIEREWVKSHEWTPVELNTGELLIFGSYLAHRSGTNKSAQDRRAVYATYNCAAEGDLHDAYYTDRRVVWPATHMMKAGVSYEKGEHVYGFGSPMMSISHGKQLEMESHSGQGF